MPEQKVDIRPNPLKDFQDIQKGQFTFANSHWNNVTRAGKHFISSLLVVDQNARQTSRSAISHPWMQTNPKQNMPDLYREVTENL